MTKIIKLFLLKEVHEELLYQYEAKDADLRKLIFGFLKPLGKQGRMTLLNGTLQCKEFTKGVLGMADHPLKEFDLEEFALKHDDKWIPEKVTAEEIKIYELTVSNKLYEDLETYGKVYGARLKFYNDSIDRKAKNFKKEDVAKAPTCFEQIVQDNTVSALQQTITQNIDLEYDEEFAELEKSRKAPPTRKKTSK